MRLARTASSSAAKRGTAMQRHFRDSAIYLGHISARHDVVAADGGMPGVWRGQRGEYPYRGGLPGPVRTKQPEDRAGTDSKINPGQRDGLPEALDQAFCDY